MKNNNDVMIEMIMKNNEMKIIMNKIIMICE